LTNASCCWSEQDYSDPHLRKIVPVIRRLRQVTVKFQVDEAYVPAI